ncbi:MAG: DUF4177 domain-containing protein [Pyrinomonadaceae bacterium]|nr:DUF4177 domain-containing protein [Pyrinomonadaceae bacterium]
MKRKAWLVGAAVLIFGVAGWTVSGQRTRPAAQIEWEYKVVYVPGVRMMSEKALNDLGAQGWELVTFQQLNQEGVTIGAGNFYMKRLKQNR